MYMYSMNVCGTLTFISLIMCLHVLHRSAVFALRMSLSLLLTHSDNYWWNSWRRESWSTSSFFRSSSDHLNTSWSGFEVHYAYSIVYTLAVHSVTMIHIDIPRFDGLLILWRERRVRGFTSCYVLTVQGVGLYDYALFTLVNILWYGGLLCGTDGEHKSLRHHVGLEEYLLCLPPSCLRQRWQYCPFKPQVGMVTSFLVIL